MAGIQNDHQEQARVIKINALLEAAECLRRRYADDPALPAKLLVTLAGGYGDHEAGKAWDGLVCIARELTGIHHGQPGDTVQTRVLGALCRKVAAEAYYAEHPEAVFAGLSAVS